MSSLFLPDEAATLACGMACAKVMLIPTIIFLYGNLGTGKTTFARGFLRGMGYSGKVKSPTYTLVEPYELGDIHIFHFDFYRLHEAQALEMIGIQDYFTPKSICLIEWPEQVSTALPMPDLSCYFTQATTGRYLKRVAHSSQGQMILQRWQDENPNL